MGDVVDRSLVRVHVVPDVRFAWIGQDATIDKTMESIVHELVEAFNDAAGLEIGDRC